jgi:hypothetical protein
MKTHRYALALVALALMITITASAASTSASLKINNPVVVSGQQIAPGTSKVSWTQEGEWATVTISKGKTKVATGKAKLVSLPGKASYDSLKLVAGANGQQSVAAILMEGRNVALVFNE